MSDTKDKTAEAQEAEAQEKSVDVQIDTDKLADAVAKQLEKTANLQKKANLNPAYEAPAKKAAEKSVSAKFIEAVASKDFDSAKQITLDSYKAAGRPTDRLMKALNTSDDSTLVPIEFDNELAKYIEDYNMLRRDARVITANTNVVNFNEKDSKPSVSIIGEGSTITNTEQDQSHRTATVLAYKGITSWTYEFEQDVEVDIMREINEDFAESIADEEENTFLNRATAGQEGLFQVSGVESFILGNDIGGSSTSTGQTSYANTTAEDVHKAYATLLNTGISRGRNAKLYLTPEVASAIMTNAKANEDMHLLTFVNGRLESIAGVPVVYMNAKNMPADGTATKFAFIADLSRNLYIADRSGTRIDLGESDGDFENGRRSLRVIKRTGHAVMLPEGVVMLTTSTT